MANLPEDKKWTEVYQWETSDRALGGPDSQFTKPIRDLTARTGYLKEQVEKGNTALTAHEKSTNHPAATIAAKGFVQLNSAVDSTSEVLAATPKAVKTAMDKANSAASTASTAQSTANTANSTANTAKTNAATAQSKADSAYTLASTANTSASNAVVTANIASSTASDALSVANTAKNIANLAKTKAETDATTTIKGRVQLSSAVNSQVENQAATPKAVNTAYNVAENALPKTGGTITGDITIGGNVEIKSGQSKNSNILKTTQNGSFIFSNSNETKTEQKIAFNSVDNTLYFTNLKNVAINNQPIIKTGDFGIGAIGAAFTSNNFDAVAVDGCGFYNLGEKSNGTFPANFSKLCSIINMSRSLAQDKKGSQIIIDTVNNRIAFRTASNSDFKEWSEILTTFNLDEFCPIGVPIPYPVNELPPGNWLKCNGWKFDKNKYKRLAVLYPDGFTPEMRAVFIRGWDDGRGIDSGRALLSYQSQQVAAHRHVGGWGENITSASESNKERSAPFGLTTGKGVWCGASGGDYDNALFYTNDGTNGSITTSAGKTEWPNLNEDGLVGMENRPRNIAFLYIMRAA